VSLSQQDCPLIAGRGKTTGASVRSLGRKRERERKNRNESETDAESEGKTSSIRNGDFPPTSFSSSSSFRQTGARMKCTRLKPSYCDLSRDAGRVNRICSTPAEVTLRLLRPLRTEVLLKSGRGKVKMRYRRQEIVTRSIGVIEYLRDHRDPLEIKYVLRSRRLVSSSSRSFVLAPFVLPQRPAVEETRDRRVYNDEGHGNGIVSPTLSLFRKILGERCNEDWLGETGCTYACTCVIGNVRMREDHRHASAGEGRGG